MEDSIFWLGLGFALLGVVLFVVIKTEGENKITLPGGVGIQVSHPALVVFCLGAVMMLATKLFPASAPGQVASSNLPPPASRAAGAAEPGESLPARVDTAQMVNVSLPSHPSSPGEPRQPCVQLNNSAYQCRECAGEPCSCVKQVWNCDATQQTRVRCNNGKIELEQCAASCQVVRTQDARGVNDFCL